MRPDVALISPYPNPGSRHSGRSGVASYTANLAAALTDRGASVVVVAPEDEDARSGEERDGDVRVVRAFRRGAAALPRAAAAARALGARVVHLQHEFFLYGGPGAVPGLPVALAGLRAARVGPVVTMHHAVDASAVDADFMRLHRVRAPAAAGRAGLGGVQAAIRRLARRVIVHEPLFSRWVRGATVVPHGLEPLAADPLDAAGARAALGLEDRFTAVCLGFIAPYKGLEVALEAAALAPDAIQLVVAGAEHPRLVAGGDSYARDMRQSWSGSAHFTGHVPEERLAALFAAADVALFLYPSVFSSSGALALALAHRRPVLLSPALAESVAAPELAVELDPATVAGRLRELSADSSAYAALGRASEALTDDRSWSVVADRHLEVYEEVSNARGASRRLIRAA